MSKELFDLSSDRDKFSTTFGKDLLYPKKGDDEPPKKDKKQVDLAGIISASALGLDSITNTIATFTGNKNPEEEEPVYEPRDQNDPSQKKAANPWLIGGVLLLVFLLIAALAYAKRKNNLELPPPNPSP